MGDVTRTGGPGLRRRTAPALLSALALVAVLAACGDDDEPDSPGAVGSETSEPTDTESGPEEPTETEPTEPTESEPTEDETPLGTGVAPASGKAITVDGMTFRLPEGWTTSSLEDEGLVAEPRGELTTDSLEVIVIQNDGLTSAPAAALRDYKLFGVSPPRSLPPIDVDGVAMFHGSGEDEGIWIEAFGSNSTAYTTWFTFKSSPRTTPLKERREIADSVLATIDYED